MLFLLRSAFWLGWVFSAMPFGDQDMAAIPRAAQGGLCRAAGLEGLTCAADPALAGLTRKLSAMALQTAASIDSLDVADRTPVWRGRESKRRPEGTLALGLRGTL